MSDERKMWIPAMDKAVLEDALTVCGRIVKHGSFSAPAFAKAAEEQLTGLLERVETGPV